MRPVGPQEGAEVPSEPGVHKDEEDQPDQHDGKDGRDVEECFPGAFVAHLMRARVHTSTLGSPTGPARRRKALSHVVRGACAGYDFGRTPRQDQVTYVGRVNRLRAFLREYGFDLLVLVAAVESALETALRPDLSGPASWLAASAVPLAVLCLLGRRRLPFPP